MEQPNISTVLEVDTVNTLLKVDWNKVSGDSASVADKIKKKLHIQSKSGWEKFQVLDHRDPLCTLVEPQEWSSKNVYLAGGFTGGFFLGIASS